MLGARRRARTAGSREDEVGTEKGGRIKYILKNLPASSSLREAKLAIRTLANLCAYHLIY